MFVADGQSGVQVRRDEIKLFQSDRHRRRRHSEELRKRFEPTPIELLRTRDGLSEHQRALRLGEELPSIGLQVVRDGLGQHQRVPAAEAGIEFLVDREARHL